MTFLLADAYSMGINATNMDAVKEKYWQGEFENGYAQISKNGYFGLIDSTGSILIEPKYDEIGSFNTGIVIARINNSDILINQQGLELTSFEEVRIFPVEGQNVYRVKFKNHSGLINQKGELVTAIEYTQLYHANNRFFLAQLGSKWGVIDAGGKEVIPAIYDEISKYVHAHFIGKLNHKYSILNEKGDVVKSLSYDSVWPFDGKYAQVSNNGLFGLVNQVGEEVLACKYEQIAAWSGHVIVKLDNEWELISNELKSFSKPLKFQEIQISQDYLVVRKNELFGVLNKELTFVVEPIYPAVEILSNDLFKVRKKQVWAIVNAKGEKLTGFKFTSTRPVSENIEALFVCKKREDDKNSAAIGKPIGHYFLFNTKLEELNRQKYFEVFIESEELISVKKSRKDDFGYINTDFQEIIPFDYAYTSAFNFGIAKVGVLSEGQVLFGLIDQVGKTIIPPIFENVKIVADGTRILVQKKELWTMLAKDGTPSSSEEFEWTAEYFDSGVLKVRKNNKYGFIDLQGNLIIPTIYDEIIGEFNAGRISVKLEDQSFFINKANLRL